MTKPAIDAAKIRAALMATTNCGVVEYWAARTIVAGFALSALAMKGSVWMKTSATTDSTWLSVMIALIPAIDLIDGDLTDSDLTDRDFTVGSSFRGETALNPEMSICVVNHA